MGRGTTILSSPDLYKYILETSAFPNEHEQLKEIRMATVEKYGKMSVMGTSPDEAQFLSILLKLMNAKNTLELGVFTGYSLLATALALPHDGTIVAVDPNKEAYEFGLPFIRKAGVDHKINFFQTSGLTVLDNLLNNGKEGTFDFAFIDADKENYINYHKSLMKLVKVGGLIVYDNTLWSGSVAFPDDVEFFSDKSLMKKDVREEIRSLTKELNIFLASDPCIESILLSISDGVTLCRRKY